MPIKFQRFRQSVLFLCVVSLLALQHGGRQCGLSPASAQVPAMEATPSTQVPAAENAAQTWWDKLQKLSPPITACHVTWKCTMSIKPKPDLDVEKRVAQIYASALKRGLRPAEAQKEAEMERREALRDIKGRTIVSILDFVRVGRTVRCAIEYPEMRHRSIEFYDGASALSASTHVNGVAHRSIDANLTSDPKEVLRMSAGGEQMARFLLGIPLHEDFSVSTPAFSPENTILTEGPENTLLLERKFDARPGPIESPTLLTLSQQHGRPLAYEISELHILLKGGKYSRLKGKLAKRIGIESYRKYPDGVWFPSKITVTSPTVTKEYSLLKAAFNGEVDPLELRLPKDMRVADARFGYGRMLAIYQLKDGLLASDYEVMQMLNRKHKPLEAEDDARETIILPDQN